MSVAQTIAEHVFRERKQRKWSRIALAEQAGVGKTVVWDIEHAKPTVRLQTLIQVCGALDMTLRIASATALTREGVVAVEPLSKPSSVASEKIQDTAIAVTDVVAEELPDYLL